MIEPTDERREPEYKDTNFANPFKTPKPAPDGRADGYDPDGDAVAAEFKAAFRLKNRPVEYADDGESDEK